MFIVTFGDLHGYTGWAKFLKGIKGVLHYKHKGKWVKVDKVIFLGDYLDEGRYSEEAGKVIPTISGSDILRNFENLIKLKKAYPDQVVLLLGNHDQHYYFPGVRYAGYRTSLIDAGRLININRDVFNYAYQYKNFLWTHAGVTEGFYLQHIKPHLGSGMFQEDDYPLVSVINYLGHRNDRCVGQISKHRFGSYSTGSFIWADIEDMKEGALRDMVQVVGHTHVKHITIHQDEIKDSTVYFVDCVKEDDCHLVFDSL